jgi:hypothetical protein
MSRKRVILTVIFTLLCLFSVAQTIALAADGARVAGDLKVDGIHFSIDGSVLSSANQLLKSQGDWSANATYSVNDVVQNGGVLYVCTTTNFNTPPPNASFWATLQGPAGPQGLQGLPGAAGPRSGRSNWPTRP